MKVVFPWVFESTNDHLEPVELVEVSSYTFKDKVYMALHNVPHKVKEFADNPHFYSILDIIVLRNKTKSKYA